MHFCRTCLVIILFMLMASPATAQIIDASTLFSYHTLQAERIKRRDGLYKYTILPVLKLIPDTTNQESFQSALWAISQYMLRNDSTRQIIDTLFNHYPELENSTRRSLMEVVYGIYPTSYISAVQHLWLLEKDERVTAMMVSYLRRNDPKGINEKQLQQWMINNKSRFDSSAILQQMVREVISPFRKSSPPTLSEFFENQQQLHCKIIYSLQRSDRSFPGLAIIQNADGSFMKDSSGRLKTFVQLARSASNLPYFITNGNTPQGVYRIKGTDVSKNNFIGPTPNIQLRLPYEIPGDSFFVQLVRPVINDSIFYEEYRKLFPAKWILTESFYAGKCGRGAIIAHGTTIDPWYYRGQSFYPCTPTLGCLCAKEIWNPNTGKLVQSDQLNLVNTFLSTPGTDGYLFVINIDDKKTAVTPEEVTALVKAFKGL